MIHWEAAKLDKEARRMWNCFISVIGNIHSLLMRDLSTIPLMYSSSRFLRPGTRPTLDQLKPVIPRPVLGSGHMAQMPS